MSSAANRHPRSLRMAGLLLLGIACATEAPAQNAPAGAPRQTSCTVRLVIPVRPPQLAAEQTEAGPCLTATPAGAPFIIRIGGRSLRLDSQRDGAQLIELERFLTGKDRVDVRVEPQR